MLIKAGKEENFVVLDGPACGEPELLLTISGFEVEEPGLRVKGAVPEVVKERSMHPVRTRFGHNVHHGPAGTSQFRAVGIRRNTELLHDFVAELVRCAVTAARLGKRRRYCCRC